MILNTILVSKKLTPAHRNNARNCRYFFTPAMKFRGHFAPSKSVQINYNCK